MPIPTGTTQRIKLDEKDPSAKAETKEKKPRKPAVKNASFFLYKIEVGNLSLIDTFGTKAEIRQAYGEALDSGLSEAELVGFKGRYLDFTVTEKKRRVTVQ